MMTRDVTTSEDGPLQASPDVRKAVVAELYSQLGRSRHADSAFAEWSAEFELVHGEIERKRRVPREALARMYGIPPDNLDVERLLFAIETYFAYWLAAVAAARVAKWLGAKPVVEEMPSPSALRDWVRSLATGETVSSSLGTRFGLGELLTWFVDEAQRSLLQLLVEDASNAYRAAGRLDAATGPDLVRRTYHQLMPKQVRHAIGSFYTPRWLAEYALEIAAGAASAGRVLDPMCGSGTFLVEALRSALRETHFDAGSVSLPIAVGFDVSPIAVVAAETSYIFALSSLLPGTAPGMPIPVFLCDSLSPPRPKGGLMSGPGARLTVRIAGRDFAIPAQVLSADTWPTLVDSLADAVRSGGTKSGWLASLPWLAEANEFADLGLLFDLLASKSRSGLFRFYTRAVRDAPQPLFEEPFDLVVGNPPWVNWEHYPPSNREHLADLWRDLRLFELKGMEKAFSKEDISVLAAGVSCDRYLSARGVLCFLMPQSVFKSSLNGRGFRRFELASDGTALQVLSVDDLTDLQPFEGVTNRTAVLLLRKGERTEYPIPYRKWHGRDGVRALPDDATLDVALRQTRVSEEIAFPSDPARPESYWVTVRRDVAPLIERLTGACPYRGRTGVFTGGANGVFHLEILEELPDGLLRVRNDTRRTKRAVNILEATIESQHVYPLVRGRDVGEATYSVNGAHLLPHTAATRMHPIPVHELRTSAPLTSAYLENFRSELLQRRGFVGWERQFLAEGYYACQRVGSYTFAPYKVVWRYISRDFKTAIIEPQPLAGTRRPVVPNEKLMLIGFEDRTEAFYVFGLFNGSVVRTFVESRMVGTQIAPHVVAQLAIPRFNPREPSHVELANTAMTWRDQIGAAPEARSAIDLVVAEVLSLPLAPSGEKNSYV